MRYTFLNVLGTYFRKLTVTGIYLREITSLWEFYEVLKNKRFESASLVPWRISLTTQMAERPKNVRTFSESTSTYSFNLFRTIEILVEKSKSKENWKTENNRGTPNFGMRSGPRSFLLKTWYCEKNFGLFGKEKENSSIYLNCPKTLSLVKGRPSIAKYLRCHTKPIFLNITF